MDIPYLKAIFVVFAALGVQLIEPFYSRTIDADATHSKLKLFYKQLYTSMGTDVTKEFFELKEPQFCGVSQELLNGVKKSYTDEVIEAISETAKDYEEDCVKLVNFILPELRVVLARQRRDYDISEEFKPQYPVESQAPNVDDTPVNNISMERKLGTADYRLPKLKTLEAVSRSIILANTAELREKSGKSFRKYREEAEKKAEVSLKWNKKMKEKFAKGQDEKRVSGEQNEGKRLKLLESLKKEGGPFTNVDEVKLFLEKVHEIGEKEAKRRLKDEMKFARDTSTNLPKSDAIFRIQVTQPNKVWISYYAF